MASFRWTCPHCNETQTVVSEKTAGGIVRLSTGEAAEGSLASHSSAIGCSNPECGKTTVRVKVGRVYYSQGSHTWIFDSDYEAIFDRQIVPEGAAKPQPDYIPEPLRADYYEACLIRDLSPKASATLTRRCLQGMIRDFAQIKKGTLYQEITALKEAVENGGADRSISEESVEAIDHVRGVGNIGAHMEKDIDVIVDVDPGEAQALIELVEMLFDEWYGARERRKQRLSKVSQIAVSKQQELAQQKAARAQIAAPDALAALAAPGGAADLLGASDASDGEQG